jgi:ubiquinone/menaquinone biosynthesis C-methylase UbiE
MPGVRNAVNEFWNLPSVVDGYDSDESWTGPEHRRADWLAWQEDLRRVLPEPPARIVDLASGTGYISLLLAEMGYEVRGIDAASNMLERARIDAAALGLTAVFEHGDVHDPHGTPSSADAVTARHVFWTLDRPQATLAGAFRLLRPGGRLVIAERLYLQRGYSHGSADSPWYEDSKHLYTDDVQRSLPLLGVESMAPLEALAGDTGFVDIAVSTADFVAQVDQRYLKPEEMTSGPFLILTARKPA